jgi:hypothetical protein
MADNYINLIKLCVGIDSVEDLIAWRKSRRDRADAEGKPYIYSHVTRMWPKRSTAILAGGSLYWVIKGFVLARQRIIGLEERIGADGIRRCAIVMDPDLIRTTATPRRPFQGWRYLSPQDAPADLPKSRAVDDVLPPALELALADIGLR